MTFQNAMHIVVTAAVVLTTLASSYLLAIGYLRRPDTARVGRFALVMAIGITAGGLLNPIGIAAGLNIMGLTERITIYSLQLMIIALSAHHTFADRDG